MKQEAIGLLLASPGCGVFWDGIVTGKVAQWLAQVEGKALGGEEYVPYGIATNADVTDIDIFAKTANLQALLKDKDAPRKTGMREMKISCHLVIENQPGVGIRVITCVVASFELP